MPGYVYKITNIETGMWYIGSHNGKKSNYMGSGLLIKAAIKKYGTSSFLKEILYEGDDYRDQEDQILKEMDAASNHSSYNLKNEALGGSFPGPLNGMYGKKLSAEHRYACGNAFRGKRRLEHSKAIGGSNNPMYGKNEQAHSIIARALENKGKSYDEIFGAERSMELKTKLSKSQTGKKHILREVTCQCGKSGSGPNMTRYHFENCEVK